MAEYVAQARLYVGSKIIEESEKFSSDAKPGKFWKAVKRDPLDHDGDGKKGGSAPPRETLTLKPAQ